MDVVVIVVLGVDVVVVVLTIILNLMLIDDAHDKTRLIAGKMRARIELL